MARKVKVCVIGAGSAGLFSLGQVRRKTKDFVIIDGGPLGTTCARVGCMPSKVLIQAADDYHHRHKLAEQGIFGAEALKPDIPKVLAHVRKMRDGFAGKVAKGFTMGIGDKLIRANARFIAPGVVQAGEETIEAEAFILAVGSRPVMPEAWAPFADRLLTTDTLFEQEDLPPRMAVLGLGAIGLEMGQALARLGIEVTGVDMLDTIAGVEDPEVRDEAIRLIGAEFPLWLGAPAEITEAENGALRIRAGDREVVVDKALVALGRRHNLDRLDLAAAGVTVGPKGLPEIDPETLQIPGHPIFVAGDANGERPVLHEAGDEGRIAGFNAGALALGESPARFQRKKTLAIVFSDPNIAKVGASWESLKDDPDVVVGSRNFDTQGRAKVMRANAGLLRLYGRKRDGLLLGAEMVAPRGEHLAHHLSWAMERNLTVFDLIALPFYHPVIEEGLENALYDLASKVTEKPKGLMEVPFLPESGEKRSAAE